jgi:hypothetical protein
MQTTLGWRGSRVDAPPIRAPCGGCRSIADVGLYVQGAWAGAGVGRSLAVGGGGLIAERRAGCEAGSSVTQLAFGSSDVPPCAGRPRRLRPLEPASG